MLSSCVLLPSAIEKPHHFVVGYLAKILVPEADGIEIGRGKEADDAVDFGRERPDGVGSGHGHRKHDLARAFGADRSNSSANGAAGRYAIIDDNDRTISKHGSRVITAKPPHALFDFATLALGRFGQLVVGKPDVSENLTSKVDVSSFGDGTHAELRMPGNSDLSHHPHIERSVERARDFVADRNAPARKRENDGMLLRVCSKFRCQLAAGIFSIAKPGHTGLDLITNGGRRCHELPRFLVDCDMSTYMGSEALDTERPRIVGIAKLSVIGLDAEAEDRAAAALVNRCHLVDSTLQTAKSVRPSADR
jgi:hypothetical protein